MQTRTLGNSDLHITPIGFGAWAIGGAGWQFGWGAQDDKESTAAILKALELGINWIDTAPVYGLGHSEEVVAKALKEWPGLRPYIFTKCGLVWNHKREVDRTLRADSIRRECDASLKRLGVDVIDLFQIHWPSHDIRETEDGWSALLELQQEGKVRWIGVSNFNRKEMEMVREIAPITSLQAPYSAIRPELENDQLVYCLEKGIGTLAYSPMASGLLSGAMSAERIAALPDDDWRKRNAEFKEPKLSRNLAVAERLKSVAGRHGRSAAEAAIAWALRDPAVTGAIVGARTASQVQGIVGAAEFRLSPGEVAEVGSGA